MLSPSEYERRGYTRKKMIRDGHKTSSVISKYRQKSVITVSKKTFHLEDMLRTFLEGTWLCFIFFFCPLHKDHLYNFAAIYWRLLYDVQHFTFAVYGVRVRGLHKLICSNRFLLKWERKGKRAQNS